MLCGDQPRLHLEPKASWKSPDGKRAFFLIIIIPVILSRGGTLYIILRNPLIARAPFAHRPYSSWQGSMRSPTSPDAAPILNLFFRSNSDRFLIVRIGPFPSMDGTRGILQLSIYTHSRLAGLSLWQRTKRGSL